MPRIFDDALIEFPCPKCGRTVKTTLGAGRRNVSIPCPGGHAINVDGSELDREMRKADKAEIEKVTFDHQSLGAAGSGVGSGGMIAIAEGTCMVRLLQVMLRFYHHESCGQCTPCREGTGWMHRIIDRIIDGKGVPEDIERLYAISHANDGTTICGMGDAAGYATIGIIAKFRDEFEYWIANKRSLMSGVLEVAAHA